MEHEGFNDILGNNERQVLRIDLIVNDLKHIVETENPYIDFHAVIQSLQNSGSISDVTFDLLLQIPTSEQLSKYHKLFRFLDLMKNKFTAERVFIALCTAGCGSLFKLFLSFKNRERISHVGKVSIPYNNHSNERYRFLKTCVDNNCFNTDKRQVLTYLRNRAKENIRGSRTRSECQKYLEEKVLIDLHRIQLCGVKDLQVRFDILSSMKKSRTQNLDRTSLDLTYHSKMAVTYAKIGQQNEAEEHIQQTLVLCDRCLPCFATIMALNDVIYAYQELYFMNRTQDLLEKAKDFGQLMYHVMSCDDEKVVNQWKRIIFLFMAMVYLNISHEFEVCEIDEVSMEDVNHARVLISEVKKLSMDMETRREMVMNLCQGRSHERDDKRFAIFYVEKSYNLIYDGCLRVTEKSNIEKYLTFLRS